MKLLGLLPTRTRELILATVMVDHVAALHHEDNQHLMIWIHRILRALGGKRGG